MITARTDKYSGLSNRNIPASSEDKPGKVYPIGSRLLRSRRSLEASQEADQMRAARPNKYKL